MENNLKNWLELFSKAVREKNFPAGKKLLHQNVFSFGTACHCAKNLDELVERQWKLIWLNTENFDFDYVSAQAIANGDHAVIMTEWNSTGFRRDKIPYARRGRATIVLEKFSEKWLAVHTHFSMKPEMSP